LGPSNRPFPKERERVPRSKKRIEMNPKHGTTPASVGWGSRNPGGFGVQRSKPGVKKKELEKARGADRRVSQKGDPT